MKRPHHASLNHFNRFITHQATVEGYIFCITAKFRARSPYWYILYCGCLSGVISVDVLKLLTKRNEINQKAPRNDRLRKSSDDLLRPRYELAFAVLHIYTIHDLHDSLADVITDKVEKHIWGWIRIQ
jgi:hypothetical protein